MPRRTIVCLANSKKYRSFCVAGVDVATDEWIRPVGSGDKGAVTAAEQTLPDGSRPQLLDLIDIPLARATPQPGQPENWRLSPGQWRRTGHLDQDDARELFEDHLTPGPLFGDTASWIADEQVQGGEVDHSLAIIQPSTLTWVKNIWPERWEVRCHFAHAGSRYDLPVTDPEWRAVFTQDDAGTWSHDQGEDVFLITSLGEADSGRNNKHWKLIAGVICLSK